jgi:hypothetical protein
MPKAVAYTGAAPALNEEEVHLIGEWQDSSSVADATVADGVAEYQGARVPKAARASPTSASEEGSTVATVGDYALSGTRITALRGVESVAEICSRAFRVLRGPAHHRGLGLRGGGDGPQLLLGLRLAERR